MPPGARVASPPAGTALARAIRDCLPGRVRQERDSLYVTQTETKVNVIVTKYFQACCDVVAVALRCLFVLVVLG